MVKFSKILKNLGYKGNLLHEAEFQMYFETTGEVTFYFKLEKHILNVSIENVYAMCKMGQKQACLYVKYKNKLWFVYSQL